MILTCKNLSNILQIDSFRKLNSQLHVTELKSAGNETPKFLICKNGEQPEDALPDKMRKAYEKKGLLKSVDDRKVNDRYADNGDDDPVEDGTPEPTYQEKRRQRKIDGRSEVYDKRKMNSEYEQDLNSMNHHGQQQNEINDSGKEHVKPNRRRMKQVEQEEPIYRRKTRSNERTKREVSPTMHEEPLVTARRSQNAMSKSQSRESVGSKHSTKSTPRQNGTANKPQPRIPPSQRRSQQQDDEMSSESQQNPDESDSDDDYPEPRVIEPRTTRGPRESPEY